MKGVPVRNPPVRDVFAWELNNDTSVSAVFTLIALRPRAMLRVFLPLAAMAALAGCGEGDDQAFLPPERDPVAVQAVNDQIMTDPDLSSRNEANAALTSSTENTVPPVVGTAEAIETAKAQAAELLGKRVPPLPPVTEPAEEKFIPASAAIALQDMAALTPTFRDCAEGVNYTARWAVDWPSVLPIYPLANLREGAGNTSGDCDLRAVSLLTPVARDDVSAFYYAKARAEGMDVATEMLGPAHRITARGRGMEARIYTVSTPYGQTRLDMVLSKAK